MGARTQAVVALGRRALPWILPALLAAAVALPSLWNGLAWDDGVLWQTRPTVHSMLAPRRLIGFRGFTELTHGLDRLAYGDWVPGHHLTNLFLYALATGLAARAGARVPGSPRVGLLCGLAFAVHPVHVEAFASIANRKDLLALIFLLAALFVWSGAGVRRRRVAGACILFGFGLWSKEVAVIAFPALVTVHDALFAARGVPSAERRWRWAFRRSSSLWLVAIVGGAYAWASSPVDPASVQRTIQFESNGHVASSATLVATALASVPRSVGLLLWPSTLSVTYPIVRVEGLFDPLAQFGALLLLGGSLLACRSVRSMPVASFGLAWTLLTFLPASNLLLPFNTNFVQDRYLFVPSFGWCLALAALVDAALVAGRRPRLALAATALVLLAGAARAVLRTFDWRTSHDLVLAATRDGIETARLVYSAAAYRTLEGDLAGATAEFERALELRGPAAPFDLDSHLRLAELYFLRQMPIPAAEHMRAALALRDDKITRLTMVRILVQGGSLDEASEHMRAAEAHGSGGVTLVAVRAELDAALAARAAQAGASAPSGSNSPR